MVLSDSAPCLKCLACQSMTGIVPQRPGNGNRAAHAFRRRSAPAASPQTLLMSSDHTARFRARLGAATYYARSNGQTGTNAWPLSLQILQWSLRSTSMPDRDGWAPQSSHPAARSCGVAANEKSRAMPVLVERWAEWEGAGPRREVADRAARRRIAATVGCGSSHGLAQACRGTQEQGWVVSLVSKQADKHNRRS